jgi:hypothetical protein
MMVFVFSELFKVLNIDVASLLSRRLAQARTCTEMGDMTVCRTRDIVRPALNVETHRRVRFRLGQPHLGKRREAVTKQLPIAPLHKSSAQAVAACATVRIHHSNHQGSFQPPPKHSEAISMAPNGTRKGEVAPQCTPPPQQANVPQRPLPRQTPSPSSWTPMPSKMPSPRTRRSFR